MFKELFSHIKGKSQKNNQSQEISQTPAPTTHQTPKIDKTQEEYLLNKEFPRRYLFWGKSTKNVCEDGLSFTYKHYECFLANDPKSPTAIKRLTGDNLSNSSIAILKNEQVSTNSKERVVVISALDDNVTYEIQISKSNNFDVDSLQNHNIFMKRIITEVNAVNDREKEFQKKRAREQKLVDREFAD